MRLRRQVPSVVRELPLDERRLAWGVTTDETPIVATASGLHLGSQVLAWTQVEKVTWRPPYLTLVEVAETEGRGVRHDLELSQDDRLAETIRAGVTSSIAWTDVRRLVPSGKVRVVARRVPGQDALHWQVVYLDGTDATDPALQNQAEQLVASLRATLG